MSVRIVVNDFAATGAYAANVDEEHPKVTEVQQEYPILKQIDGCCCQQGECK
jgi:hypothetical protein